MQERSGRGVHRAYQWPQFDRRPQGTALNEITARHYACPDGSIAYSNAAMGAKAVRAALDDAGLGLDDLRLLSTATNSGRLPGTWTR